MSRQDLDLSEVVNSIQKDRLQSVASVLEQSFISSAMKNKCQVFFELIQNGHDAVAPDQGLHVQIKQMDDYVIFSNNGALFSESNLRSICSFGDSSANAKSDQADCIGCKDLGFKSVFTLSDKVVVVSGEALRFKFDKQQATSIKSNCPWFTVPFLASQDDIPSEVETYLQARKDRVHFVIKVRSQELSKLDGLYKDLYQEPENFVFLSRLERIDISRGGAHISSQGVEFKRDTSVIQIRINGMPHSSWEYYDFDELIPDQIRDSLDQESSCPARYRTYTHAKIRYAFLVDKKGLKPHKKGLLFCGLPTKINIGLSCLVQADFLLNDTRDIIYSIPWNRFLTEKIAYDLFNCYALMARNKSYLPTIFSLLPEKQLNAFNEVGLSDAYNRGEARAIDEVAFIAPESGTQLLRLGNAKHDEPNFFHEFSKLNPYIPQATEVIHHEYRGIRDLQAAFKGMIHRVPLESYAQALRLYFHSNFVLLQEQLKLYIAFIKFLASNFASEKFIIETLKACPFVLSSDGHFYQPKKLFFKSEINIPWPDSIELLHVNQHLVSIPEVSALLEDGFGVAKALALDVIQRKVLPLFLSSEDPQEIKLLFQCIFVCYQQKQLNGTDLREIGSKLFLRDRNFKKALATSLYLPDCFQPAVCLDNVEAPVACFLHSYFSMEYQAAEIPILREFLLELGCMDSILIFENELSIEAFEREHINFYDSYRDRIKEESDGKVSIIFPKNKIKNHIDVRYSELIGANAAYRTIFFNELSSHWHKIKLTAKHTEFSRSSGAKGSHSVTPYLFHYLQKMVRYIFNDRQYSASQLYAFSLKPLLAYTDLVCIDFDLTEEQVDKLGFKGKLSAEECTQILDQLNLLFEQGVFNKSVLLTQHTLILKYIASTDFSDSERIHFNTWDGKLFANNNELQLKSTLTYLYSDDTPQSERYLKCYPGITEEQYETLCKKRFGIAIRSANDSNYEFIDPQPLNQNEVYEKVLLIMPAIVWLEALANAIESDIDALMQLCKKLARLLRIVVVDEIHEYQLDGGQLERNVILYKDTIYYQKSFGLSKVKSILTPLLMKQLGLATQEKKIEHFVFDDKQILLGERRERIGLVDKLYTTLQDCVNKFFREANKEEGNVNSVQFVNETYVSPILEHAPELLEPHDDELHDPPDKMMCSPPALALPDLISVAPESIIQTDSGGLSSSPEKKRKSSKTKSNTVNQPNFSSKGRVEGKRMRRSRRSTGPDEEFSGRGAARLQLDEIPVVSLDPIRSDAFQPLSAELESSARFDFDSSDDQLIQWRHKYRRDPKDVILPVSSAVLQASSTPTITATTTTTATTSTTTTPSPRRTSSYMSSSSNKDKKRTGYWGEYTIFNTLKRRLLDEYKVPEHDNFKEEVAIIHGKKNPDRVYKARELRVLKIQDDRVQLCRLRWFNYQEESGKRKDLTLDVFESNGESVDEIQSVFESGQITGVNHIHRKHIEVKSTIAQEKMQFEMSDRELACARKHKDSYALFRVFNVDTTNAYYQEYLNPVENGSIQFDPIQYRVTLPSSG